MYRAGTGRVECFVSWHLFGTVGGRTVGGGLDDVGRGGVSLVARGVLCRRQAGSARQLREDNRRIDGHAGFVS